MKKLAQVFFEGRKRHNGLVPNATSANRFTERLIELMFPGFNFTEECTKKAQDIEDELKLLSIELGGLLRPLEQRLPGNVDKLCERFFSNLPKIYELLCKDVEAIYEGDPAAESLDEVIVAYPGFYASAIHRVAHEFYAMQIPLLPRLLSEIAHQRTGIDIHPGAQIGEYFCIDHGTGIVVGETCVIGARVKLYQGVTLGALSVDKSLAAKKRHPTIEDNVVLYSNATILGGETVIGKGSVIGGNVWITSSVAPGSTVYHKGDTTKVRA